MAIVDRTPAAQRAAWSAAGLYDDLDVYRAFRRQVDQRPDQPAVIDDLGATTYAELLAMADRLASMLSTAGVGRGDIVAVQLPNRRESCAFDYAIAAVGAVNLPMPINFGRHDVRNLLTLSEAVAYVTIDRFQTFDHLGSIADLRPELPTLRTVFALGGTGRRPDVVSVDDALAPGRPTDWTPIAIHPDAPVRISVTSGTEAFPKLVVNGHNATGRPYEVLWGGVGIGPGTRILIGSPLGSGMGQIVTGAVLARLGATIVVMDLFTPAKGLALTERTRPEMWWLVPTMVQLMLADPTFATTDTSSIRTVVCAGSPVPPSLVRRLDTELGWTCVPTYGFVDGGLCSTTIEDSLDHRAETVGRPDPRVNEIRIAGPDGTPLPAGDQGEILCRGPFSPLSYLNSPELDERYRTADGWVRSGDLGVLDHQGYLHVTGRVKDVIVRGGMNISPAEIEGHLVGHPDIVAAACVGYPDEVMGERVCACLVVRSGAANPTVAAVGEYLTDHGLMRNKLPERVVVVEALPTSPVGKILKRVLREQLASAVVPAS